MAAVAGGHGGDAGGDPPPGPHRIPSSCERSNVKKVRGKSRSLNLLSAFKANGRKPLPIEFEKKDLHTYHPVGDNHTLFTRCIGNWIGFEILIVSIFPYFFCSFISNSIVFGMGLIGHLLLLVLSVSARIGIETEKNKNKTHFLKHGGYDDVERAKQHPPTNVNSDNWKKTVDHFLDPKYMNRSETNVGNRACVKYPSLHGSISFAASLHKKRDPQTQELPSLISFWADMHRKKTGEWVNDLAKKDYEKMLAEKESQTQGLSSTSTVDEIEIISKVLGESHGHNTGRGRKLKGVETSLFASQAQSTATSPEMYTTEEVQDLVDQCNENAKKMNLNQQALYEAFMRINPEVTLPSMHELTPISLPPPRQPPQQPQQTDDGEDELDLDDD
ncbi:hypothetical protein OSB04_029382 [Centaurea solstitialis]|uniref:Uncharacterized protein n=1 Tax=Centaurea solstitialis TaxID=347529 RepID=A0AA38SUE2_9ASTR|nr:hypothetical protein OSB04_029382 [Centaurea solstitialis]